jgi:hypothetical protein
VIRLFALFFSFFIFFAGVVEESLRKLIVGSLGKGSSIGCGPPSPPFFLKALLFHHASMSTSTDLQGRYADLNEYAVESR